MNCYIKNTAGHIFKVFGTSNGAMKKHVSTGLVVGFEVVKKPKKCVMQTKTVRVLQDGKIGYL